MSPGASELACFAFTLTTQWTMASVMVGANPDGGSRCSTTAAADALAAEVRLAYVAVVCLLPLPAVIVWNFVRAPERSEADWSWFILKVVLCALFAVLATAFWLGAGSTADC